MQKADQNPSVPLLSQIIEAARERNLSQHTIRKYRRVWAQIIAWALTHDYSLQHLPDHVAADCYAQLTERRGPSHHLQVKAAIRFLYQFLDAQNPFSKILTPKFDINKVKLKYLPSSHVAILLEHLRLKRSDYFSHLTYYLAEALFLTAKRYHEWAELTRNQLLQIGKNQIVRLQTKGGKFQDVPIPERLSLLLKEWNLFKESIAGIRMRNGAVSFAASPLLFPGRDGAPYSNESFNKRLKIACQQAQVPIITAHGLRHSAATLLLNEKGNNLKELQALLGHRSLSTTARYTHVEHHQLCNMVNSLQSVLS